MKKPYFFLNSLSRSLPVLEKVKKPLDLKNTSCGGDYTPTAVATRIPFQQETQQHFSHYSVARALTRQPHLCAFCKNTLGAEQEKKKFNIIIKLGSLEAVNYVTACTPLNRAILVYAVLLQVPTQIKEWYVYHPPFQINLEDRDLYESYMRRW